MIEIKLRMSHFDYYVILDFEATCIRGQIRPQEIIEFPSVIVETKSQQIVSEFQEYIKPVHHPKLSDFCVELTGITQQKVIKGIDFPTAVKRYQKWLAENGLVGDNFILVTCGDWDLCEMYPEQCHLSGVKVEKPFMKWINIKDEFRRLYHRKGKGMVGMLEHLGLTLEGRHHSGIDDSRNIARIWIKMLQNGYQLDGKTIKSWY